jgi:hypothetical protein
MIRHLWQRINWRYVWAWTAGNLAGVIATGLGWGQWAAASLAVLIALWISW